MVGEGADDAGGVFDDTVTAMVDELQSDATPFLLPTPNQTNETGYNRDCWILNPNSANTDAFIFIGKS